MLSTEPTNRAAVSPLAKRRISLQSCPGQPKSLTARYWFTRLFRLVGSVESATVGGTRCRLTLCRLAIGAHLLIREERLSRLPTCGACRFVLNPSPSPRPSASWKARPIGLGTIPGVFRASGNSAPVLGPSVVGLFGVCVVVEAIFRKKVLTSQAQVGKKS